eukprot:scaffold133201_cov34-Tisochrysis_lutea.AAC.2
MVKTCTAPFVSATTAQESAAPIAHRYPTGGALLTLEHAEFWTAEGMIPGEANGLTAWRNSPPKVSTEMRLPTYSDTSSRFLEIATPAGY